MLLDCSTFAEMQVQRQGLNVIWGCFFCACIDRTCFSSVRPQIPMTGEEL